MAVPNQKTIIIERTSDKVRSDYFKVSNSNLRIAMYNLRPSTFMLWVYFADNENGRQKELYPVDFMSKTGVSRSTYDRAFIELEEKGYLMKIKDRKNLYLFCEESQSDELALNDVVRTISTEEIQKLKVSSSK